MRAVFDYLKARAQSGVLVVAATLVVIQTVAGTVFDFVLGVMLIGLIALTARFGR